MERKTCTTCNHSKELSEFYKSKQTLDGCVYSCKVCWSTKSKEKRAAAREVTLENVEPDARFLDLANLVKAEREKRRWTQEELGEKVGVGPAQVRLWEKSKGLPRQKTLKTLCELLGVVVPMSVKGGDGDRIPLAVRFCVQCGNRFPQYKAHVRHCSRKCSDVTCSKKQLGMGNHNWDGGRCSAGNGYFKVKVLDHPRSDKDGYVAEHRLVMERHLGRHLESHERVHHRNGDRSDNRLENLELWKVKTKDPPGVRASDYHCPGCRCHESTILESCS